MTSYGHVSRFIRSTNYAARTQASESASERYQGLRLLTDCGHHVAVMIEEGHYCCEEAGYRLNTAASLDQWLGQELREVKWVNGPTTPTFPPLPAEASDQWSRALYTAVVEFTFAGDTPPLRVILYNDRNPAAYSHQIFKVVDGRYDWQDL
jgi:hypothetical protein